MSELEGRRLIVSLEEVVSAGLDVVTQEDGFQGFKLPLHGVGVGADGGIVVVRFSLNPDRPEVEAEVVEETLWRHLSSVEEDAVAFPVMVMLTDREQARFTLITEIG